MLPTSREIDEALNYAVTKGIVISKSKEAATASNLVHVPVTYLPSPIRASSYEKSILITKPLNQLVAGIARDFDYLQRTLDETANADAEFTGKLMQLAESATDSRVKLAICRYDYFEQADGDETLLRMVEMNCIASSFGCLGTRTSQLHRHVVSQIRKAPGTAAIDASRLPNNNAENDIARGIFTAHSEFIRVYGLSNDTEVVMAMIVQPDERNAYDQFFLQNALWERHGLRTARVSLTEMQQHGEVGEDGILWLDAGHSGERVAISVVYYRSGYVPADYPSENEWFAREKIESSVAVKCPSAAMQLVGTKKIQQILDKPGEVERFVQGDMASEIRSTFARQYSLSSQEDGDNTAQMAINNCAGFVLKPQREGGGNNLYGEEMKQALLGMSLQERAGYVVMERIRPVQSENVVLKDGMASVVNMVSEFGVFGVIVETDDETVEDYVAGTLLRSKAASQDDGGVAAGVAVLDSLYLVD